MDLFNVRRVSSNVHFVRFEKPRRTDWEQWGLFTSDHHFDSTKCNRKLMKKHLTQAKERGAFVGMFGDFFDAMQGKYDPRKNYDELREEYKSEEYLDNIVEDAVSFLDPFKELIVIMGMGNHESSIKKKLSTNLIKRVCEGLGIGDRVGGYGGWIKMVFDRDDKKKATIGSSLAYYHHGAGGGGPVTRGTIQTNRQAVYLPDPDVVINGHTHDSWVLPIARHRISKFGKIYKDYITFIRIPGYKEGFGSGDQGFEIERWMPPKPCGAVWVRYSYVNAKDRIQAEYIQDLE